MINYKTTIAISIILVGINVLSEEFNFILNWKNSPVLDMLNSRDCPTILHVTNRPYRPRVKCFGILNGFYIMPRFNQYVIYLNYTSNIFQIRTLPNENIAFSNQILFANKNLTFKIKSIPFTESFNLKYPNKVLWKKADLFEKLPADEFNKIHRIVSTILDAYERDDLSTLRKEYLKRLMIGIQAVSLAWGESASEEDFNDMSMYESLYHKSNRKSAHILRDFTIKLNTVNKRVVNVFNKNGEPLVTLVSQISVPFRKKQFSETFFFYNFIKIDGEWWIY